MREWSVKNRGVKATINKKSRTKHSEYLKEWRISNRGREYGLTLDSYHALNERQDFLCAICGDDSPLCIDHSHKTDQVRGLLCDNCNKGIGLLKDDSVVLLKAVGYLTAR